MKAIDAIYDNPFYGCYNNLGVDRETVILVVRKYNKTGMKFVICRYCYSFDTSFARKSNYPASYIKCDCYDEDTSYGCPSSCFLGRYSGECDLCGDYYCEYCDVGISDCTNLKLCNNPGDEVVACFTCIDLYTKLNLGKEI